MYITRYTIEHGFSKSRARESWFCFVIKVIYQGIIIQLNLYINLWYMMIIRWTKRTSLWALIWHEHVQFNHDLPSSTFMYWYSKTTKKMMGISDLYFYGVHVHINIGSKLVFLMNHRFWIKFNTCTFYYYMYQFLVIWQTQEKYKLKQRSVNYISSAIKINVFLAYFFKFWFLVKK